MHIVTKRHRPSSILNSYMTSTDCRLFTNILNANNAPFTGCIINGWSSIIIVAEYFVLFAYCIFKRILRRKFYYNIACHRCCARVLCFMLGTLTDCTHLDLLTVPPNIDDNASSSDMSVGEGANVTMSCRATGSPEPFVKWKRDNNSKIKSVNGTYGKWLSLLRNFI